MTSLPVTTRGRSGLARSLGRLVGSVFASAIVVGGIPVALARVATRRFGGPAPWTGVAPPTQWRTESIRRALSGPITESVLADVMLRAGLVVAWVALVVLAATMVAEIAHRLRYDGIPLPRVRGLGWAQPLARAIASGLVVLASVAPVGRVSASVPARLAVAAEAMAVPLTADQDAPSTDPAPSGPTLGVPGAVVDAPLAASSYVVEPGDSVWGVARRIVGGSDAAVAALAEQILDLNLGRAMTDGVRFTNAAYIEPGWVLLLPPGVTLPPARGGLGSVGHVHRVEPGDTLSAIARAHLGDPDRWPELWRVNDGKVMPDGRTFVDPHLILPGWQIDVPSQTTHVGSPVEDGSDRPDDGSDDWPSGGPGDVVDDGPDDVVDDRPDDVVDDGPGDVVDDGPDDGASIEWGDDFGPATPGATVPDDVAAGWPPPLTPVAPVEMVDGVDDTDARGDLDGARSTSPRFGIGGAAMMSAGLVTLLVAARTRRLRTARPPARLPDPRPEPVRVERILRQTDAAERLLRLDLGLRSAAMTIADQERRLLLALVDPVGELELVLTGRGAPPSPWSADGDGERWVLGGDVSVEALATPARTAGAPCLALVQLGVTDDGRDLYVDLESLGILSIEASPDEADEVLDAIATTLGSSVFAEVARLVGVGVDPARFVGHPLASAAPSCDEALAVALAGEPPPDVTFALRARGRGGEVWEPTVVLAASSVADIAPEEVARVVPGQGLAMVVAGPVAGAPARLRREEGRWWFRVAGDPSFESIEVALEPVRLRRDDADAIASALAAAEVEPVRDEQTAYRTSSHDGPIGSPADADPVVLASAFDAAETEPPRHEEFIPQWALMVRLLGPVDIVTRSGEVAVFEKSKTCELLAWLATHRERSTRSAARTALWESDVRDATFANVVSAARRTLARLVEPPSGEEWVGRTQTEQLPLHPLVTTDADEVAARLRVADGCDPVVAIDVLTPAVHLIRGMPFEGTSYLWPDAEGITSNLVLLVISVASTLAEHHLDRGDVQGVFDATAAGLRALPGHEGLIALRLRAHAAVGDHAGVRREWEAYQRVVNADPWSDGEPAPELVALRDDLLGARR